MGFFDDLCNREWCCELECACGVNVVLLTATGFAFFGLLDRFEDGIVTLVPAANESEVFVVTPGGEVLLEDLSYIDLCEVVAVSKNAVKNPFRCLIDATPHTAV